MTRRLAALTLFGLIVAPGLGLAQVTAERIRNAADEPHNWLTYSGGYHGQRHTGLGQIAPGNVNELELKWVHQANSLEVFETSPLVVDGIMYLTEPPNTVVALDAKLGRVFWTYEYTPSNESRPCCGAVNRGLGILGDTLFMATLDANLVAIDAWSGKPIWITDVADPTAGYAMTVSPLVVKDKVIVGVAGGEYGVRGFIAAYDARTGEEAWRFYTIPGPGEPGHETWGGGDAWQTGGAGVWVTGAYDPELNLTYWGVGNPGPDFNAAQRPGDNLYSDCVVALDADTGELRWYFQFTPGDPYDYDSTQVPVLIDYPAPDGGTVKLMVWGNRNGFFYVLDRASGQFVSGRPYVDVNWAEGLDDNGRPIETPQPLGSPTYPGPLGGTNWYSPSYSPDTGLFYVSAWDGYGTGFEPVEAEYQAGRVFIGGRMNPTGVAGAPTLPGLRRGPVNNWTAEAGRGAVKAIDPATGEIAWQFEMTDVTTSGLLTTASGLLFTGGREGYFHALDATDGRLLWKATLGGMLANGPMSYAIDDQQYVAVAAGHSLFVFGLRD